MFVVTLLLFVIISLPTCFLLRSLSLLIRSPVSLRYALRLLAEYARSVLRALQLSLTFESGFRALFVMQFFAFVVIS